MKLEKVKSFIDLAKDEGVAELKYEEKDFKISVSFNSAPSAQVYTQPAVQHTKAESTTTSGTASSGHHEITSPFVGTFYSSPAPGKPQYVKVGDRVSNGQTLCILEAMKIMNEIESDIDGEIVEICVENESLVEYGQVLYRIKK
jgi:acetyl-CoA carboxylase biotin carboxyl carrier protein